MEEAIRDLIRIVNIKSVAELEQPEVKPYGKGCRDVLTEMLSMGREAGFSVRNYDGYVGCISLNDEEKELKKQIKAEREKLHIKTKETIESLSDEEVLELIESKWIDPLICNITDLPIKAANDLVSEVKRLADKYRLTLSGIEAEIIQVEEELSSMLDDLTGNEFDMLGISELKKLLRG